MKLRLNFFLFVSITLPSRLMCHSLLLNWAYHAVYTLFELSFQWYSDTTFSQAYAGVITVKQHWKSHWNIRWWLHQKTHTEIAAVRAPSITGNHGNRGGTRHEWHFCELIRKFPEVCFLSIQTATTTASKLGSGQQLFQSALVWGSVLQYTLLQREHTSAGGGISPAVTICRRNTDRDGYRFQLQKNLLIYSLVQEQLSHLIDHIVNHILV